MPNSLIWLGLVAVWLFVLVPMFVNSRPRIRRTTDVALATRVLHRGGSEPAPVRGPAAGHRSDPNFRDPNFSDPNVRPESAAGAYRDHPSGPDHPSDEFFHEAPRVHRRGRGGFDPEADAIARDARYAFRQRTVLASFFAILMSGALAFLLSPMFWSVFAVALVGLTGYLVYLRRQVRIEEEVRRRRSQRLQRSRLGVESRTDDELSLTPERLRRPGAVVLEVDDEDPIFDHLEHYDGAEIDEAADDSLRRVVGQ